MKVVGYGSVILNGNITTYDVIHVLDCKANLLLSIDKLMTNLNYYVIFGKEKMILLDHID